MTHKLNGLYVITDASLIDERKFTDTIKQTLDGGANIIQYRDKSNNVKKHRQQASDIKRLCEQYKTIFIINDDFKLAKEIDADGVHLGSNDSAYDTARKALGNNKLIGITCYNQFDLALKAQSQGADYAAFGSFFSSSVKPDAVSADTHLLERAKLKLSIPVCAIGGITLDNSTELITAGADMLAVISAIFSSHDIKDTCQTFSHMFISRNNT